MGKKESNSYVITDINPELWKQFKHKLIDDDLELKAKSESAYKYAISRRTWDNTIERTIEFYKNIL